MNPETNLLDEFIAYLRKSDPTNGMVKRLIELGELGTLNSLFYGSMGHANTVSNLATFMISARQIHGHCRDIVERLIFHLFQKLKKSERASFFFDLNREIKQMTGSVSKNSSAILFLDLHYLSLTSEESEHFLNNPNLQILSEFLVRLNGYEDFMCSKDEVQQLFDSVEELSKKLNAHSNSFIKLYNDLIVRSSMSVIFTFEAD